MAFPSIGGYDPDRAAQELRPLSTLERPRRPTHAVVESSAGGGTQFRAFLDLLSFMVWEHDATGAVVFANAAWYRTIRLPRTASALTIEAWRKVLHPDDLERISVVPSGGGPSPAALQPEFRLKPADSDAEYRWYVAHTIPQGGARGELQGWLSCIVDVTERRREMEQLRSELSDTKLLQSISAAMIQEENVDALYKKFVEAAVQIMGSDCGSMQMFHRERGESGELRLLASHGFSPEAEEYWKWVGVDAGSTCAESLRTRTRTIAPDIGACGFTKRRNDRAAFLEAGVHAAQSTPLFSRTGELIGMITTHWLRPHQPPEHTLRLLDILARQAADLIERKLAEKALRESEERFRAFVATSSDVTYRMSADWREMRHLDGRDFIADTSAPYRGWIDSYIHPEDQARVTARINEAIATKTTFDLEHRVIRVDGTLGWTHSRAIPLLDENGEITEWFGAATDITLKKEAEAQQKAALRESQRMVETFQTALLPPKLPQLETLRFDAVYVPAGEGSLIGGDWYDAAQLPDGRILISIGDVTGHGLSAAVTAGKLRQAATVAALTTSNPAEILDILNRVQCFQHPDIYATAIVGFIDADCREFTYANAGHPPALLATDGGNTVVELERGGLPLGIQDDFSFMTHRLSLPENFVLALYSDGLTEFGRDVIAAEASIKRVLASVAARQPRQDSANAVLEGVLGQTPPSDDVVLLLARRTTEHVAYSSATNDAPLCNTWRFHSSDEPAVREVRSALAKLIGRLRVDEDTGFAAQIILGEALANTVQHAAGMVDVGIEAVSDNLVITVCDRGPGMSGGSRKLPHDPLAEKGRGLFLMQALAAHVSVQSTHSGGTALRAVVALAPKDR